MSYTTRLKLRSLGPKFARFGYDDPPSKTTLPIGRRTWRYLGEPKVIDVTVEKVKLA